LWVSNSDIQTIRLLRRRRLVGTTRRRTNSRSSGSSSSSLVVSLIRRVEVGSPPSINKHWLDTNSSRKTGEERLPPISHLRP